ncbi:hypothetical protein MTO96_051790, partial [Rhipicephalus appendiculatus]
PPKIAVFPRDQTVVAGGVAVFVCTAVGDPRPLIEWRQSGKLISVVRYRVTEITGDPARAQFTLTVLEEHHIPPGFPHFKIQPNLQSLQRNGTALLPCKAEGDPEPKVFWLHNDIPVDLSDPRYSLAAAGK